MVKARIVIFTGAALSAFLIGSGSASAACTVPHTLTNGQTADATEVMADIDAVKDCINNAPSGATNSIQTNGGSGTFGNVGPLTDGQLAIGSTGNSPQAATLTAGPGIIVTNAPGAITIAASGGGGGSWDFAPPTAASLSLQSGDATQLSIVDDSDAGLLFDSGLPVSGDVTRMAYRTLSNKNLDWNIVIKMPVLVPSANYISAGIIIRDSVGGRLTRIGFTQQNPGSISIENYNGLTGYNGLASAGQYSNFGPWLRVQHIGGNYLFYVSATGKNWVLQYTVGETAFLANPADQVGFGVSLNKGGGQAAMGSIPYLSITGPGV